jgi:hypothetical protein
LLWLHTLPAARTRTNAGLYFAEGVLNDLPEAILNGWTCYYHAPYCNITCTDDILGNELGEFILVAAKRRGSSTLSVAAMGRRAIVLEKTMDEHVSLRGPTCIACMQDVVD